MSDSVGRRAFLAATGSGLGAAWMAARPEQLAASLAHSRAAREAQERGAAPPLEVLTPEQAADVEAIAAQIIPTDDLPGAREARVVNFIDHALATWAADQRPLLIAGLAMFNNAVAARYPGVARFSLLGADRQLEFLRANDTGPFFNQMVFATKAGMFAPPAWGGNFQKAGYHVLGFEDRYLWQPPFGWYDDKANGGPN